jgi:hypothetical protein
VLQKIGMKLESGFGKILDIENEEEGFPILPDFKKEIVKKINIQKNNIISSVHNAFYNDLGQLKWLADGRNLLK